MLPAAQIDAMRRKLIADIGFYQHAKQRFCFSLADEIFYDNMILRLQALLEKEY